MVQIIKHNFKLCTSWWHRVLPISTIGSAGVKVAQLLMMFSSAALVFISVSESDCAKNIWFYVKAPYDVTSLLHNRYQHNISLTLPYPFIHGGSACAHT